MDAARAFFRVGRGFVHTPSELLRLDSNDLDARAAASRSRSAWQTSPYQALRVRRLPGRLVAPPNTSIETRGCFEPRRSVRLERSKRPVRAKSFACGPFGNIYGTLCAFYTTLAAANTLSPLFLDNPFGPSNAMCKGRRSGAIGPCGRGYRPESLSVWPGFLVRQRRREL